MIGMIEGTLSRKEIDSIQILNNGIGFDMMVPLSTYEQLGGIGETVRLFTYLFVREDVLQLYGFSKEEEKNTFAKLISVSGIGPKLALSILSSLSIKQFITAVVNKDIVTLTNIGGIGKKTAERLALELKEKLADFVPEVSERQALELAPRGNEAVDALVALGYHRSQAEKVVGKVLRDNGDFSIEDIIKNALAEIK